MDELNQSLDQTTAKFSKLDGMLKSMVNSMTKLTNSMGKVGSSLGNMGFGGQQGLGGATNQNVMSGSLASFAGSPKGVVALSAARAGLAAIGGAANMMPDVGMTMTRAAGYYTAARMSGMSRQELSMGTFSGLNGGITQRGLDAAVSATFAQGGIAGGSSLYNTGLGFVKGMAGSLGVDNMQAAQSFAATYSGRGASNLMRGSGIMLTDPRTGKQLSTRQLFGQLESRIVNNPNASVDDINSAIRSGYLTESVTGAGLTDPGMQQSFFQYLRDKAQGKSTSWLEGDLAGQGDNPLQSIYNVESAATGAMDKATDPYIQGISAASDALVALHGAAGDLAAQFGALKSSISYFTGDSAGGAVTGAAKGIAESAIGGALAYKALGGIGTKASSMGVGGLGKGALSSAGGALAFKGASKIVPGLGGVVAGVDAYSNAKAGKEFDLGGTVLNTALAAGIGFLTGGPAGAAIAGGVTLAGAIGGHMLGGQGGNEPGTTNASAGNASASGKWLSHPVDNPKITARFNQKYSSYDSSKLVWPNGHRGIDYEATTSTTIKASADGLAEVKSSAELGTYVLINHQNGFYTFYCHLSSTNVGAGHVKRGQAIGKAGDTGSAASGVHLHFAVSTSTSTANVVDPELYLGGAASSTGMTTGTSDAGSGNGVSATAGAAADMGATSANGASGPYWSQSGSAVDAITQTGTTGIIGTNQAGAGVNATSSSGSPASWYGPNSRVSNVTVPGAATGVDYVPQDGLYRLHQGESVLTSKETAERRDSMRGGSKGGGSVVINVNVSDLSEEEAVRFSKRVKEILEKENVHSAVGRK